MEYVRQLIPRHQANIMLYVGISLVIGVGLLCMRTNKVMRETTRNRYIIQENEVLPGISYYAHAPEQVKHIIITSDQCNIWLLCYYFIVTEQPVQPIFFMETARPGEILELKKIRSRLMAQFPHKQARLLPTYYVNTCARDLTTSRYCHHLLMRVSGNLGITSGTREYQLLELAGRFASDYPWPILMSAISGSIYSKLLGAEYLQIMGKWDNARINCAQNGGVFNNLRFPIIHMTAAELINIALDSKYFFYDYIIYTPHMS